MKRKNKLMSKERFLGQVVTPEEIKKYRRVPTLRKLEWLDEIRNLMSLIMTPKLLKRYDKLRRAGY